MQVLLQVYMTLGLEDIDVKQYNELNVKVARSIGLVLLDIGLQNYVKYNKFNV